MFKYLFIIFILIVLISCYRNTASGLDHCIVIITAHPDSVITKITKFEVLNMNNLTDKPIFPFGIDSLENVFKLPDLARKAGIYGEVTVNFNINKNGQAENIIIVSSIPMIDDAVIKELTKQKFLPAKKDGIIVDTGVQLSVMFSPPKDIDTNPIYRNR